MPASSAATLIMAPLQSPQSVKLVFGTAGLERWDVETVRQVFDILIEHGVDDLDAAHIYVGMN